MGIERLQDGVYRINVRLRINGRIVHNQKTLTGSTREGAKATLEKMKATLRAADTAGRSLIKTFGDALTFYQARHTVDSNSETYFNRLEKELGTVKMAELKTRFDSWFLALKATKSERGMPLANGTLNRYLIWSKTVLNYAIRAGGIKENPIKYIERMKEIPRDVMLSEKQEIRLLNTIEQRTPYLSAAVRYMLQVPCRAWSEVVTMRREDVDLFSNCIRVRNGTTKTGAGIDKPIPPDMVEYFRSIPPESEYAFWRKVNGKYLPLGRFAKSWMRCTEEAGLAGLRVHDLRHVAATRLIDNGTPEQVVMTVAGWKTNMLRVYYHREPKKALELIRFSPQCEQKREHLQVADVRKAI